MRTFPTSLGLLGIFLSTFLVFVGCESTDEGGSHVSGSAYYGVGFHDPWYYGGAYYPPDVIVTPPPPDSIDQPHPAHPIALPPPAATPRPTPMPSIPSMPRPAPRR
jgi:hypothetical protein